MDDLSYLSTLTPEHFEAERCKIIANEILKAPPDQRKKLVVLQMQLDRVRDTVTPEEFMVHCFRQAGENLENIADLFVSIGHQIGFQPERKHV